MHSQTASSGLRCILCLVQSVMHKQWYLGYLGISMLNLSCSIVF